MMPTFPTLPAFATAMQDPLLRGNPRDLYWWFFHRLDVVLFRPVKTVEFELELQMRHASALDALRALMETGYIERGARLERVWTYRLVHSNPERERALLTRRTA